MFHHAQSMIKRMMSVSPNNQPLQYVLIVYPYITYILIEEIIMFDADAAICKYSDTHPLGDGLISVFSVLIVSWGHSLSCDEAFRCSNRSHPNTFSLFVPFLRTLLILVNFSTLHPDRSECSRGLGSNDPLS